MGIVAALNHVTHYRYSRPVAMGMQTIRLRPAPHTRSNIQSYSLTVSPAGHFTNWQQDPFGNYLACIVFPEKVSEFRVEVDLLTEIRIFNPFDFFLEDYAKEFPFAYPSGLKEELAPYLEIKEKGPLLQQWLASINRDKRSLVEFLVNLNQETNHRLKYLVRMEPGVQLCEDTLANGSGSCRDMAWLLCQLLRHLGFATRFASGYLIQLEPDVKPLEGPAGTDKDFTDLHAWTEVYLPGAGWIGLDPTSGLFVGEGHIPLCCTPSPSSAAPISGTHEPCELTFDFRMEVARVSEPPRVTRPFSNDAWQAIDRLGAQVDKALKSQDVRLTMGGEPTFISDEDRAGNEWHFTALSDAKKHLGKDLFLRLKRQFASGGIAQYTQGKWYPGEILPRWAMQAIWRKDGEPVWQQEALLADPLAAGQGPDRAKNFLDKLAGTLGIPEHYILPAYEDTDYYSWKEKSLPLESKFTQESEYEKTERARIKALRSRADTPSGYVLPLQFSHARKDWITSPWKFQGARLILIPGDSPVGLRLPLGSLPFVKEAKTHQFPERKPSRQTGRLPSLQDYAQKHRKRDGKKPSDDFAKFPSGLVRNALCAEARDEVLYIFLPPLPYIEHFLELVAGIEKTAAELQLPVVLEGYPPPSDLRLHSFSVTPDPGVLEVNIHPASDWEELKAILGNVYAEAKNSRLSAEKFLLDGRRVGTGGGNHIVVGAGVVEDSPFLRRPDLLSSLLAFWQNHPSLSYLFSSMYIGPTSQSPRIDEARLDSLYELEIAMRELEKAKGKMSPAQVDRLFRNLLVDLTGNTHRAEFCIDKLYSPDGSRGKLGLLELRAFEMSPHPQMNLLQSLLIRAAIAHFWEHPYRTKLIRWGTSLHDRFMLPHYLREDMRDVLEHFSQGEYEFKPEWFEPFFAFRFPSCGTAQMGGITLELHMALEPWPVLGEEMNAGSVSRSVDSSVERLQVTVRGALDARHVITCNGRRLPLHATSEREVMVAGVRYKAWAYPSSLHPSIPVQAPLVFDVLDRQLERSLGGCTYHTVHPGGRNYEFIPVNENEAEGRRLSRFEAMGHRPGKCSIPAPEHNPDFPTTLDLRR